MADYATRGVKLALVSTDGIRLSDGAASADPGAESHRSDSARREQFPHGADIGVRGYGPTVADSLAAAALALTAVSVNPDRVARGAPVTLDCEQTDRELLLVDWLNATVDEMAVRHWVFGRYDVMLTPSGLNATLWGEALDRGRHRPALEVEGATCTALAVRECAPGW